MKACNNNNVLLILCNLLVKACNNNNVLLILCSNLLVKACNNMKHCNNIMGNNNKTQRTKRKNLSDTNLLIFFILNISSKTLTKIQLINLINGEQLIGTV